ncbi:MAG: hypothetical protein REI11_07250 [Patulibacter sp.]|nr:hypothetical protein [Patulibacter sp.]
MSSVDSSPAPGASRRRLTQRQLFIAKLSALALAAVVAIGLAIFFRERATTPSMTVLVKDARSGLTIDAATTAKRQVDGIGFPDWSARGWTLAGGRTDDLGHGRIAATAVYQSGGRILTATIVSGTGEVENGKRAEGRTVQLATPTGPVNARYFGFGANVLSDGAEYIFRRPVNGRTVVMTGTPISPPLYTEMVKLLAAGPWTGGAAPTTP